MLADNLGYCHRVSQALRLINICDALSSPNTDTELKQHRLLLESTMILKLNLATTSDSHLLTPSHAEILAKGYGVTRHVQ